jgi:methyl-accepting chemotaxis protein
MTKQYRIQQKLLVPYLGSILLLFTLFSLFTVNRIRHLVQTSVMSEANELLDWGASEICGFLTERGRIPTTVFKNPFILDWFARYKRFRAPIQRDAGYYSIINYFNTLLEADSTLNSVYFATDNTQEYFDEDGRFEEDGYFVKERPWWHKAIRMNRLYCELGGYDYEDSTMAASLQMPVYLNPNHLLGVGGVDIELSTISNLILGLKYQGHGQAFLVNEQGEVFVFPGYDHSQWYMHPVENLDETLSAIGFKSLHESMRRYKDGMGKIEKQGELYRVLFKSVSCNQPYLRWQLAFMIPEKLVTQPVRQKTWEIMRWILFAGLGIILFGTWRTLHVLRPLDALSQRLHTIANERSDLTLELPVLTHDAIGRTAENFNKFLHQIRDLVSSMISHTKDVAGPIDHLHRSHETISSSGKEMSEKVGQVAETSGQMILHVEEVMQGVKEVTRLSKQFLEIVDKGKDLVKERMQRLGEMTEQTLALYEEMRKLHIESNNLIDMVRTIDDINGRVSLLSVNAAIEAVKAGERGQGFAVVAKEIETLSQGTAETNRQTLEVVRTFSESMEQFEKNLEYMKETMLTEKNSFTAISEMFYFLADQANRTDQAAVQMHIENQQQVESLQMINDSIQSISKSAHQVAESISSANELIHSVYEHMQALQKSAQEFKV